MDVTHIHQEQNNAVSQVIKSGNLTNLHGNEVNEFADILAKYVKMPYCIPVNSGTAALHLALKALDIGPGDEVILPAYTFISTASAVLMCGAKPVFCDIEKNTYSLNPDKISGLVNEKTKAVIAVHINGIPCRIYDILKECHKHILYLIEDCCQALGAIYKGIPVGSWGDIGVYSFYPSKIITTGEGGAVVCRYKHHNKIISMMANHGRKSNSYSAEMLGYNYRMTEIQGTLGKVGMKYIDEIIDRNRRIYFNLVDDIEEKGDGAPLVPDGSYIVPTMGLFRSRKFSSLSEKYFLPLYKTKLFYQQIKLSETEDAWLRTYRIKLQD